MNKIVQKDGFLWQIRPESFLGKCTQDMLGPNDREEYNFEVLKNNADPNGVFVDVGAMVGGFSIKMAKYYKSVIAFEPDPFNYAGLKENILLNHLENKISYQNSGLGNVNKTMKFYSHGGTSRVVDENFKEDKSIDVKIFTLDYLITPALDREISIIKIDTEGFEENVLEGAVQTLKKYKPLLLIETHEFTHGVKDQIANIYKFLEDIGYEIQVLKQVDNGDMHLYAYPKP